MPNILQGTTPSLKIKINDYYFKVLDVSELELKVWQDNKAIDLTFGLSDVEVNLTQNSFKLSFTEEQTLQMHPSSNLRWQMRVRLQNGEILGTRISEPISVLALKSEERLS